MLLPAPTALRQNRGLMRPLREPISARRPFSFQQRSGGSIEREPEHCREQCSVLAEIPRHIAPDCAPPNMFRKNSGHWEILGTSQASALKSASASSGDLVAKSQKAFPAIVTTSRWFCGNSAGRIGMRERGQSSSRSSSRDCRELCVRSHQNFLSHFKCALLIQQQRQMIIGNVQ